MKLKSFGCSFIFGSELPIDENIHANQSVFIQDPSHVSWPLLLAEHYGLELENYAEPGCGNLKILHSILAQAELDDPAIFLINWTFLDRYDFITWPDERWKSFLPGSDSELNKFFFKHFYQQYHSMLLSATYITTAITVLKQKRIPFCMTVMDKTLFEPIDPNWQDPYSIRLLQKLIAPDITWFDDQDFLSWSRSNNFPISNNWHPLEQAHTAAAEYMIKVFDKQKIIDQARQALS